MQVIRVVVDELPESCEECERIGGVKPFHIICGVLNQWLWFRMKDGQYKKQRHPDCPLVEKKPFEVENCC